MSLKIDNEFKNLIPPLTKEEYQQLEENLIKEGCIDALILWNGTIVDGHNRYEICTRRKIHFDTKEMIFNSKEEVKEWIIRHQFGRRNISINQRSLLALRLEDVIKAMAKLRQKLHGGTAPGKNTLSPGTESEIVHTDKELAKIAKVSEKTIQRTRVILKEGTEEQKERFKSDKAPVKTIYNEIRKPKEDKPVITKPNKLESKEKEEIKKEAPMQEAQKKSLSISLDNIKLLVNNFLADAERYLYMPDYICKVPKEEKREMLKEIEEVKNWYENFKRILQEG